MNLFEIIVMGLFQGLTEFLPVSSSGHLVLLKNFFNLNEPSITIEVFLHFGTLMAVIVIFRKDIINLIYGFIKSLDVRKNEDTGYGRLAWLIIIANIPAGLAGILLDDAIASFFKSSLTVYIFLIITGLYLFMSKFCREGKYDMKSLNFGRAVIIGISQMAAILPGISRSGATITTGFLLNVKHEAAAKFSFFIMLPAVAGATLLEIFKIDLSLIIWFPLIAGVVCAFISGYLAIKVLLKLVKNYKLHYFAYYCVLVGLAGIIFRRF